MRFMLLSPLPAGGLGQGGPEYREWRGPARTEPVVGMIIIALGAAVVNGWVGG